MTVEPSKQTVIQYPWKGRLIWSIFLAGLYSWWVTAREHVPAAAFIFGVLIIAYGIAQKRRRIVISDSEIEYWPDLGGSQKAHFSEVASIVKKLIGIGSLGGRVAVSGGVELSLRDGNVLQIPLDLPNREEVFDKIVEAWKRYQEAHAGNPPGGQT